MLTTFSRKRILRRTRFVLTSRSNVSLKKSGRRVSVWFPVSLVLSTWSFLSNLCIELGSTLLPLSAVVCLVRVSVFVVLGHASCSPLSESPFVLTYGDWMRNFVLAKSGWVFDTGLLPVVFCPHARKIVKSGWQVERALYPSAGQTQCLEKAAGGPGRGGCYLHGGKGKLQNAVPRSLWDGYIYI